MPRDPALTALLVGLVVVARSVGGGAESVRQAQHDRVSQRPVRLAMRGDHESNEIVGSPPSATDGVRDALPLLGAQPERGFAGVADVAVSVLAAEQERLGTPAVARATSEHDDPLLAAVLVLDPGGAAPAREIWGVETLEHDAFEAVRPRRRHELGRLLDEVRGNDPAIRLEIERLELCAARDVRQIPRRASAD